jgi:mRNA interferase RelE/StbE
MFRVLLHARAEKVFARLDPKRQRQIARAIETLRDDPLHSPGVAALKGELAGLHRLRVGDFRVVYEVEAEANEVFILAIGPRGDIYK